MSKERTKGTREETAIVNDWNARHHLCYGRHQARRMPASSRYDIYVDAGGPDRATYEVLATRADYGERLVTMRWGDFKELWDLASQHSPNLRIEVKRYARFALHAIFFQKFGTKGGK